MELQLDMLQEGPVPLPASFAQERLWFLDRLQPGTAVYNMPIMVRMATGIDRNVLERCLSELARRHETLRTSFVAHGSRPVQLVWPRLRVPLALVDLRRFAPHEREGRLAELAGEQARRPFDLSQGPLLRATLYRLGAKDHAVLLVMHHIISDAWSVEVLMRELDALYSAFAAGAPSPLAPLPIQYADWAQWQRERLAGEALEAELAFWRAFLDGAPTTLELPTDRPRPPQSSYKGGNESFVVDAKLAGELRALAQRHGCTLHMVLLTAFAILLSRYSRQKDLLVGSPVTNRKSSDLESLLGLFVNTLVLRVQLDDDPSVSVLLERMRRMMLEVHAHDEVPFEKLIELLQPERSLGRHPLFQVLFSLQTAATHGKAPAVTPPGRPAPEAPRAETGTSKFDLSLLMIDTPQGLGGTWEFAVDLFDVQRVRRMTRHFKRLLSALIKHPEASVRDLPLSDPEEIRELAALGVGHRLSSEPSNVHDWIARQAAQTPDAVALRSGDETVTYRELFGRARRLANRLLAQGVGPETRVGLCMRRGPELLVSVLGVLLAGGAYVPLDPAHPKERLAHVIKDANLELMLTETALLPALPSCKNTWCVDRSAELESAPLTPRKVFPDNVAYILYTSGTTGLPKGVAVTHRAVAALVSWALRTFSAHELARVLASTSICFDISVFEIFLPLIRGGTVVLVENALALASTNAHDVTLINTVPSVLSELLRVWQPPPGLCTINLAGEALPRDLVERIRQIAPRVTINNLYGPTETTVYSTAAQIDASAGSSPPIGRPIDGTVVYVLDDRLARVPIGVPGELYIAGAGVARGYLGLPALTAERYLPDPFSTKPGGRMYRSGDVVSFRADGTLEYHGRADHQVKLRGYRIELSEIESALRAQAGVREAVVTMQRDPNGDARLVAHVTSEEPAPSAESLEQALRRTLPAYMLPSRFIFLDALPRTASGKLDKRALPAPEWARGAEMARVPASDTEGAVCHLFAEALGMPHVDPDSDFFALGGHSLLAIGLVVRAKELLGIDLPLSAIFENPTPAQLSSLIAKAPRAPSLTLPGQSGRRTSQSALPLSYTQESLWFFDRLQPGSALYNLPATLRLDGEIDSAILQRCLDDIVARHEALRTEFVMLDGKRMQRVLEHASVKLRTYDLSDVPADQRQRRAARIAERESRRPFNLRRAPLFRASLIRLSKREQLLVLVLHHIVGDGWSLKVLLSELGTRYEALSKGETPVLPILGMQYGDYAVWQHSALQGAALEELLAHFRQQLSGVAPLLALPTDHPRPPRPSYQGELLSFEIGSAAAAALERLASSRGATLFMALLAGFAVLLHRYSGQDQIVIGTAVANRGRTETQNVIGFFANTVPIRVDCSGNPSFSDLLDRVRAAAIGAYAHQELPFDRLVEELQPNRDLSYHPLFQTMFGFQDAESAEAALPASLPLATTGTAKFDLSLSLSRAGERLLGLLEYATDLFDRTTIERLGSHYRRVIEASSHDPERPLSEVSLLDDSERRQLEAWNATRAEPLSAHSLPRFVELRAARNAGAPAVVQGDRVLSYGELNRRANRLARRLRRTGVRAESVVAVYVERSPAAIVALLGSLKAGGVYLPIHPSEPSQQARQILADARAEVLLTRAELCERLSFEGPTLVLDAGAIEDDGDDDQNLALEIEPDQAACLVDGSDSPGCFEAHLLSHRALSLHAVDSRRRHEVDDTDRVFVLPPLSSAATLGAIAATLEAGAALVLPSDPPSAPSELHEQVNRHQLTVMHLPTDYWSQVTRAWERSPEGVEHHRLKLVRLEGAPPARASLRRWLSTPARDTRIVTGYGRGAAALGATSYELPATLAAGGRWHRIPAGKPLAHCELYILDCVGQRAPIGVAGELHVGGATLARACFGQPRRTAETYVPDPFSGVAGARLYRTGDLARLLPDGNLEVLGRVEDGAQTRGFLIEAHRVEEAVCSHPAVVEAAVVSRSDDSGLEKLVAYVVPGAALRIRDLELHLRSELPAYLLPSDLVLVDSLPLASDGKIDLAALPATSAKARNGEHKIAPRTPTERAIATMWAEVLGHENFGVEDNFFEVGGHSLAVVRVIAMVLDTFEIELPLERFFTTPTIVAVSQAIDASLSSAEGVSVPPLRPVDRAGPLPLSFAQERLWFLEQLEPGTPVYNIPHWVKLDGPVDVSAIERSIERLVDRHECLRTRIPNRDGRPELIIEPLIPIELPMTDLSMLPAQRRRSEAARVATEEARRSFDLANGPLLRARLLRLAPREHILLITLHHIVADATSIDVLNRDLAALYEAEQSGVPEDLLELPIQYADFASWQRAWLKDERLEAELAYWKQQLAGAPTLLLLPIDRPRPKKQNYEGNLLPIVMDAKLSSELRRIGNEEQATPFMVLLAVYGLVLARWSGSADLLVGTPVIGRPRRELEHLIGFFANTLVMRVNLGRDLTFRELVRQVRETAIHAFAHQDMPFERIVEELQPERTLGHNPLFQVMFALRRPNEMGPAQPGGARAEAPPSSSGAEPSSVRPNTSKFDLTLFMIEDTSFYGAIEYRTDIFDAATIERFANHMLSAARAVVTAPDRALSSAWSATESDLALIETWNRTTATFADAEVRVSALCAAQAARSPERPAVSSRTQVLSYRELWGQASRLAAHLRALGIGPDTRVALCIEPSVALVVAVFGILEAGGACVPLDASYPPERLQYMVQNSGVRLLVTTSTAPNVALGLERVLIDGELESPGAPPPPQAFSCDQLAYIVYTSGSTGMPKGVAMTHRALVNLVLWQLGSKGRGEARRTLQFASPSFDVFFQELALCAAAGGELVIAPPHERRDPAQLRKLCRERQIERLFLPFVALRELMDTGDEPASMPHLREVITAGEQLQVTPALRRWFSAHPNCRLYNQYGPSETHVVSEEALPADPALWSPLPPIGRPIANARLYVLDASLQPLPVGVPGDLYLGGVCLARGYLDKVDLTAARFLPDPFSPLPGARMYASGDRARWRPDGRVEFLGRKDDQIKVRGYRVELGEVEAALSRLPGVGHAVAAALPDARGDKRLVGYILPDGAKLDPSALRDALRRMLPEPLVPSILVLVDHLPRTPSGKVDRRALPAPPREGGATREPRNEIERVIAGIWCEVLGLTRVGVDDDFFELGGHSLMATQVVARLRDVLAIDLPVSRLFEYPTIARLAPAVAAALLTQDGEPDASELASIEELTEDEARRLFAAEYTGGLHG